MTTQVKPLSIVGEVAAIGSASVSENYTRNEFLIKINGDYPYEVYFICFNETAEQLSRCKVGDTVEVFFGISSKEYKEKYYTEAKAYRINIKSYKK